MITAVRTFTARVFLWMVLGLSITGSFAYLFASNESLLRLLYSAKGGVNALGYIVMLAPLVLVLLLGFGLNHLSFVAILVAFLLYSSLTGMSLSLIFLVFTTSSIFGVFFITAVMFAIMALYGFFTHNDLTRIGSIFIMLLIGIIIASLVNMFLRNEVFSYVISYITIIIFTGLTAYDIQNIKEYGYQVNIDREATLGKMSIMAALTLYLDFINIFLSLLRILGKNRNKR